MSARLLFLAVFAVSALSYGSASCEDHDVFLCCTLGYNCAIYKNGVGNRMCSDSVLSVEESYLYTQKEECEEEEDFNDDEESTYSSSSSSSSSNYHYAVYPAVGGGFLFPCFIFICCRQRRRNQLVLMSGSGGGTRTTTSTLPGNPDPTATNADTSAPPMAGDLVQPPSYDESTSPTKGETSPEFPAQPPNYEDSVAASTLDEARSNVREQEPQQAGMETVPEDTRICIPDNECLVEST